MTEFTIIHSVALDFINDQMEHDSGEINEDAVKKAVLKQEFIEESEAAGRLINARLEEFWAQQNIEFDRAFFGWSVSPQGIPIDHILSGSIEDEMGLPLHYIHRSLEKALQHAFSLSESLENITIESVLVLRGSSEKTPIDTDISDGLTYLDVPASNSGIYCEKLSVSIIKNNQLSVNIYDPQKELLEGTLSTYDDSYIPVMEADISDFYKPRLGLS